MIITISERRIRKELAEVQARLQARGEHSGYLERIARCLHWLKEPGARDYFRRAAQAYPMRRGQSAGELVRIGTLWLFAGDTAKATTLLRQAYQVAKQRTSTGSLPEYTYLIKSCLLLGYDNEAQTYSAILIARGDGFPEMEAWATLAQARQTGSRALALQAVDRFATIIRSERWMLSATDAPPPWDWYEIALRLATELGAVVPEDALP